MGLKRVLQYFYPYQKPITRFARQLAREEDAQGATRDEIILIERGIARTPSEARRLMVQHQASHALDVIEAMPPKHGRFKRRLQALLMRLEGSQFGDPLKKVGYKFSQL